MNIFNLEVISVTPKFKDYYYFQVPSRPKKKYMIEQPDSIKRLDFVSFTVDFQFNKDRLTHEFFEVVEKHSNLIDYIKSEYIKQLNSNTLIIKDYFGRVNPTDLEENKFSKPHARIGVVREKSDTISLSAIFHHPDDLSNLPHLIENVKTYW
jgi:hypothetical protein